MKLRKTKLVPGTAPGGYQWNTPDDVVDVPDAFALELMAIPDAGFAEVFDPAPQSEPDGPEQEVDDPEPDREVVEAPKPRRGRPPKARPDLVQE